MSNIKKGDIKKINWDIISFDLEALRDNRNDRGQFDYHFKLLKANLSDLFGRGDVND